MCFLVKGLPSHRMASVEELYNHTLFWRSDNSRFWFYNDDKGFHTFKAVMLTDTGREISSSTSKS